MNYQFAIKEPLSLRIYTPANPTVFLYQEGRGEDILVAGNKDYNYLLFLIEGKICISCNEFINTELNEGEFILVPIAADVVCKGSSICKVLLFRFDEIYNFTEKNYMGNLIEMCSKISHIFNPLPIRDPLDKFISNVLLYLKQGMNNPILHKIKCDELFILIRSFYKLEEIASLFHPLIGNSLRFRTEILRTYRKVDSLENFAEKLKMEKRTFSRQFKEEFGVSPYQWLLNQKAKHIRFSLVESKQPLEAIRKEYGFKFPGHFTRFCKEQFNCSPLKLRRQSRLQMDQPSP